MTSPFAGQASVAVVLPEDDPSLGGERQLLDLERAEFDAVLAAPVTFVERDPGSGPRWLLCVDEHVDVPMLSLDRTALLLVSRAADTDGLLEAFSLLPTLLRSDTDVVRAAEAASLDDAIDRVVAEVADWYPSFELRSLDWDAVCERHAGRIREAEPALPALQRWVAELGDAHTWVHERRRRGNLPYALRVSDGAATFVRVPSMSAGHRAGLRHGWSLVAIDDATPDLADWWARTGAPLHAKPYVTGRRLLAGPSDEERSLTAAGPSGARVTWQERPENLPSGELVSHRRLRDGVAYVRVESWVADRGIEDALDAVLVELRNSRRLVFDLRGNTGGNLVLACATRDRFLREETLMGSIRYSIGGGNLSQPFPIRACPAEGRERWTGELVVLTDALTYSASEDFLLGLQGLEHVRVLGEPSGGGSGRPRTLRLWDDCQLTISSALTYDRLGRCIENHGIPVDVRASPYSAEGQPDAALHAALAA